MKTISLTRSNISRLKPYPLDKVICSEAKIYYYKHDKNNNVLLKKLYYTDNDYIQRKIDTLEEVQDSDIVNFNELVFPNAIVTVQGENIGFTINEVKDCVNLHLFLEDKRINSQIKIEVLKRIGKLLEKVQMANQEFYFGDLQSYNFLVNSNYDIFVVDLDSSATKTTDLLTSKYVVLDEKTRDTLKYNVNSEGKIHPSIDGDIFCYNTLVLNYLSGMLTHRLSFEEFYDYIDYLEDCHLPKGMTDAFLYQYSERKNESVFPYLADLPDDYGRVHYNVYKALRKR